MKSAHTSQSGLTGETLRRSFLRECSGEELGTSPGQAYTDLFLMVQPQIGRMCPNFSTEA